jgi:hypothetical protein
MGLVFVGVVVVRPGCHLAFSAEWVFGEFRVRDSRYGLVQTGATCEL